MAKNSKVAGESAGGHPDLFLNQKLPGPATFELSGNFCNLVFETIPPHVHTPSPPTLLSVAPVPGKIGRRWPLPPPLLPLFPDNLV